MKYFIETAKKLGHDVEKLQKGEAIHSTKVVNNINELKSLLNHNGETSETRAARLEGIKAKDTSKLNATHKLLHSAQAFVFADHDLTDAEHQSIKSSFPIEVKTSSFPNKTLKPGEVWDLGTSVSPVVINLGTLTMEPGSSIKIANTVLSLSVNTLVRNGSSTGSANYDLGIFGVTGITPERAGQGSKGASGDDGHHGTCKSGGGIAGDNGKPGHKGSTGGKGDQGKTGYDGLPSLTATIKIGSGGITGSSGIFVISTKSGDGGQGGQGGKGGTGGTGGDGGDGATCGCEHTDGGDGGKGGNGGEGGQGGSGGNAVNGNDIYVTVLKGQSNKIIKQQMTATPGHAGLGGPGGKAGKGGDGGSKGGAHGCPKGDKGDDGKHGMGGNAGTKGSAGTQTGAPGTIYVTES